MGIHFWIGFAIGFLLACVIWIGIIRLLVDKWYVGNLREDRSIPDDPYYFMEIIQGRVQKLSENNIVLLRVRRENYMEIDSK